jgi:hypothetical protein
MAKKTKVEKVREAPQEVINRLNVLSTEVGMLMSAVRAMRRDLTERRHVSVMLLGTGKEEPGHIFPVMLAESYNVEPNKDFFGELETMLPIAPGAWLVVVGAPFLKQVIVGRDLQVGNIGNGSPVVRLRDEVPVGQRVKFVISWGE